MVLSLLERNVRAISMNQNKNHLFKFITKTSILPDSQMYNKNIFQKYTLLKYLYLLLKIKNQNLIIFLKKLK